MSARLEAVCEVEEMAVERRSVWARMVADSVLAGEDASYALGQYLEARQHASFARDAVALELYGVFNDRVTSEHIRARFPTVTP